MDRLTMLLTGQTSIQEVLFFPQMRPEVQAVANTGGDFKSLGVPEAWLEVVAELYGTVEEMKVLKHTQVHQQLNGFRKKKKLDVPALSLEDVLAWFS